MQVTLALGGGEYHPIVCCLVSRDELGQAVFCVSWWS